MTPKSKLIMDALEFAAKLHKQDGDGCDISKLWVAGYENGEVNLAKLILYKFPDIAPEIKEFLLNTAKQTPLQPPDVELNEEEQEKYVEKFFRVKQ